MSVVNSRSLILEDKDHCFFPKTSYSLGSEDPIFFFASCLQSISSQPLFLIFPHLSNFLVMDWLKVQPLDLLSPLSAHIFVTIFLPLMTYHYADNLQNLICSMKLPQPILLYLIPLLASPLGCLTRDFTSTTYKTNLALKTNLCF